MNKDMLRPYFDKKRSTSPRKTSESAKNCSNKPIYNQPTTGLTLFAGKNITFPPICKSDINAGLYQDHVLTNIYPLNRRKPQKIRVNARKSPFLHNIQRVHHILQRKISLFRQFLNLKLMEGYAWTIF